MVKGPLRTATLPQYMFSQEIADRFRAAALEDASRLERTPDDGSTDVSESEMTADAFDYFIRNRDAFAAEFLDDLVEHLEEPQAERFVSVVSTDWYFNPNSHLSKRLKASVRGFLQYIGGEKVNVDGLVQTSGALLPPPLFSPLEIGSILQVTHQMLYKHIDAWNDLRPEPWLQSRHSVYFRRGLALRRPFRRGQKFKEWDFVNGYSLTVSVPEKFAVPPSLNHTTRAIVTTDLDYFNHCVLFFSPFIRGMPAEQLEAGVIPGMASEPIAYHGQHSGIHEYYLAAQDEGPFSSGRELRGRAQWERPRGTLKQLIGNIGSVDDEGE